MLLTQTVKPGAYRQPKRLGRIGSFFLRETPHVNSFRGTKIIEIRPYSRDMGHFMGL